MLGTVRPVSVGLSFATNSMPHQGEKMVTYKKINMREQVTFIRMKGCGHCFQHSERQMKLDCLLFHPNTMYDIFD
jgi:hypothetical protein